MESRWEIDFGAMILMVSLKTQWKKGKKTHKSYLDVTKLKAIETKRGSLFEVSLP